MGAVRTPSIWLVLGLSAGICIGYHASPTLFECRVLLAAAFLCLIAGSLAGRQLHPYGFLALSSLFCLAFGLYNLTVRLPENQPGHYINAAGNTLATWDIRLAESLRPTGFYWRWVGEVRQKDGQPACGKVLLELPRESPRPVWKPSDLLRVRGRPLPFTPPANPYGFNYGRFMRHQGIHGRIRLGKTGTLHREGRPGGLIQYAELVRHNLVGILGGAGLTPRTKGLLQALILGDRTGLDPALYESYQRAGAVHLLAVSGLHVGIFAGLCGWLLWPVRLMRGGRWPHFLLSLCALWGYAFLAGFGASVVRATVICSFMAYAVLLNRRGESIHFLALAALLMLGLIDPLWLFQAGFQMSFAAVWAILTLYPFLYRNWPLKKGLGRAAGQLLCVSTAAQLGVLPISLYYFHQFPVLFWLTNLLLVPFMGFLLTSGFLLTGLAIIRPIPEWLIQGSDSFLAAFNGVVETIGGQDRFLLTELPWDGLQAVLGVLAVLSLGQWCRTRKPGSLLTAGVFLVGLHLWGIATTLRASRKAEWLLLHRFGESALAIRQGTDLRVFTDNPGTWEREIRAYRLGERLRSQSYHPPSPYFRLDDKSLCIINSSGRFVTPPAGPDYLLLTGSPRIHLGRLLDRIKPNMVLADGSNYRSFATRWAATCRERRIPFYNTADYGAFREAIGRGLSARSPSNVSSAGR